MSWQPIETAPKDREILLYWPCYSYGFDNDAGPRLAIGSWKVNERIELNRRGIMEHRHLYTPEAVERWTNISDAYFSDNPAEGDDYGLAQPEHAPTHWMPLPELPDSVERGA